MIGARHGLDPLRHRQFRSLVVGQLASNVGDAFYAVALPWYVLATHGGTILLATVLAAYGIPRTALLGVSGHASDRWRPWTVMLVADAVRAVALVLLGFEALAGPPHAALLVPIAAVVGVGEGLFLPGSFAIIPSLLPDADLQAGNALGSGATQLATLVGPATGGLVVALSGPGGAFLVDAASFAVSAMTLAAIRGGVRPQVAGRGDDVHEQAPSLRRLVRSERSLQVVLLVTLAGNLGSGGLSDVALPALAHGPFHTGAAGFGALVAAIGAGALVGALLAGAARAFRRPAVTASMAFLAESAAMAVVPFLGGPIPAGVALAIFGGLNGFGNILTITAFQRWAPPELLGRVTGLLLLCSLGIFPVSVVLGGVVVRAVGPAPFFPVAAGVLVAAILGALTQPAWRAFGASAAGAVTAPLDAPA